MRINAAFLFHAHYTPLMSYRSTNIFYAILCFSLLTPLPLLSLLFALLAWYIYFAFWGYHARQDAIIALIAHVQLYRRFNEYAGIDTLGREGSCREPPLPLPADATPIIPLFNMFNNNMFFATTLLLRLLAYAALILPLRFHCWYHAFTTVTVQHDIDTYTLRAITASLMLFRYRRSIRFHADATPYAYTFSLLRIIYDIIITTTCDIITMMMPYCFARLRWLIFIFISMPLLDSFRFRCCHRPLRLISPHTSRHYAITPLDIEILLRRHYAAADITPLADITIRYDIRHYAIAIYYYKICH